MKVVYAERARHDIADIYDSIARHNPPAAQRVEDMIRATCEGLGRFPQRPGGDRRARRAPRPPGALSLHDLLPIDTARHVVEIARVLHGARVRDLGKMPDDD